MAILNRPPTPAQLTAPDTALPDKDAARVVAQQLTQPAADASGTLPVDADTHDDWPDTILAPNAGEKDSSTFAEYVARKTLPRTCALPSSAGLRALREYLTSIGRMDRYSSYAEEHPIHIENHGEASAELHLRGCLEFERYVHRAHAPRRASMSADN